MVVSYSWVRATDWRASVSICTWWGLNRTRTTFVVVLHKLNIWCSPGKLKQIHSKFRMLEILYKLFPWEHFFIHLTTYMSSEIWGWWTRISIKLGWFPVWISWIYCSTGVCKRGKLCSTRACHYDTSVCKRARITAMSKWSCIAKNKNKRGCLDDVTIFFLNIRLD